MVQWIEWIGTINRKSKWKFDFTVAHRSVINISIVFKDMNVTENCTPGTSINNIHRDIASSYIYNNVSTLDKVAETINKL